MTEALRADLAAAYASGALDPAMTLLFETQACLVPSRIVDIAAAEAIGGALLEAESPAPLAANALARAIAQIGDGRAAAGRAPRALRERNEALIREIYALPAPVREAAVRTLERRGWNWRSPGLRVLQLDVPGKARVELIRIEPGLGVPRHTHEDQEYTLVLTGAFRDERGRYDVGDISVADPAVKHRPVAEPGDVCWNLAVSYGAMKWFGFLGVAQRLLN